MDMKISHLSNNNFVKHLIFKCSLFIDFIQVASETWYPRRATIALPTFKS